MHTVVMFDKVDKDGSLIFMANANIFNGFIYINVLSSSQEILTLKIKPYPNSFADIFTVSHVVAGCFHPNSNLYGITCINFTLNDVTLCITKENATPEKIQELYYEKLNKLEG